MCDRSRNLLRRLQRDLAELRDQPYPGVSVFTDDADMRKLCLVLTPPAGPWAGLSLHFDVKLPSDWPSKPPTISSTVEGIDHPNLFGNYICCDLLRPLSSLEQGYTGGYTPALTLRCLFIQFLTFFSSRFVEQDGGWLVEMGEAMEMTCVEEKDIAKVQYSGEGCCFGRLVCKCSPLRWSQEKLEVKWRRDSREETAVLQYGTWDGLVCHMVKDPTPHPERIHAFGRRNARWISTLKLISTWSCWKCQYGSPSLPHHSDKGTPTSLTNTSDRPEPRPPTPGCALQLLDDDVLMEVASHMPSEGHITFGQAYPRFRELIAIHHVFLLRELQCFYLKRPLKDTILGVGVALHEPSRSLSSDFDWLSLEAFTEHHVRKSIQKRDFQFFLPLAFNQGHFDRAQKVIWERVALLDSAMRRANTQYSKVPLSPVHPDSENHDIFNVLFTMMNNIVVSLMKSCDSALSNKQRVGSRPPTLLHASEKAVISYCHLMHLLVCLCRAHPEILESTTQRVQLFLAAPENRTKAVTPDMGELIVAIRSLGRLRRLGCV